MTNVCVFEPLATIHPLSILIRQHSKHTICNEVLMKGEYGCLPASLSALQSAHVIGGRVGSAAASSSPSLTDALTNPPKHCIFHCSSATNHGSPSSTSEWHWHNENPRIWSTSTGDLTQSFSMVECKRYKSKWAITGGDTWSYGRFM